MTPIQMNKVNKVIAARELFVAAHVGSSVMMAPDALLARLTPERVTIVAAKGLRAKVRDCNGSARWVDVNRRVWATA